MAGQFQRKPAPRGKKPEKAPAPREAQPLNHVQEQIAQWFQTVKFRKTLMGVDEGDLWKKLAELQALYDKAITAERARYDALLQRDAPGDPAEAEPQWDQRW